MFFIIAEKSTFVSGALSPTAAKDRILHQMSGSTAYGGGPSMAALRPTSPSQYTSSWQPFIVANIHIYTTPLAIFIRRAKDMDFSPRTFRRFITAVQRVFRVFSPEVIDAINATLKSTDMTSRHRALRTHHENKLGEFCPPDPVSLTTLQSDMHNLLEEIYFQHEKKIREMDFFARFDDKIHNLSGQGSKSELTTIDQVKKNGLEIVGLSSDYVVSSLNKSKVTDKSTSTSNLIRVSSPERMKEGLLTERGKQQILSGERVCRPQNVFGLGDPMNARVRSYEIPFLVYWSIFASRWLNAWLGLTPHDALSHQTSRCGNDNVLKLLREGEESQRHWIRINLRFLADYRNLIFLALLGSTIFTGIQIYSKFVT